MTALLADIALVTRKTDLVHKAPSVGDCNLLGKLVRDATIRGGAEPHSLSLPHAAKSYLADFGDDECWQVKGSDVVTHDPMERLGGR